jgi:CRISPR-associated endonuclease/helicase Cas3
MAETALPPCPSFADFYRAVHAYEPFPWQTRLAAAVADTGWPRAIGVPTGLGKTAAIDIALWALAAQADRDPRERRAPTRIWYVVNRRLLVDSAFDWGRALRALLLEAESADPAVDPVASVAIRLRSLAALGSEEGLLHVGLVRGGAPVTGQIPDPSMPALLFATVPMFASRWLFQGYGASRSMRPIEAALAGTDSLVLLDESHLAQPLRQLAEPLAQCDPSGVGSVLPPARSRPSFVELTATGDEDAFNLDAEDREVEIVRQRLNAAKPTLLVETTKKRMDKELAAQAVALVVANPTSATVIFVNSPARARRVYAEVVVLSAKRKLKGEVTLLTGRIRPPEADRLRQRLLDADTGARAQPHPPRRSAPLIVVATQTLEVGADLDFDHLVTETADARAIVQRFGRLNRLGVRDAVARGVICHPADEAEAPVYGAQPLAVWTALRAAATDDVVDMGPSDVATSVGPAEDRRPRTGEVLPTHLWEWAKTSCPPTGRAPIEPFIEGIETTLARVLVTWRVEVPATTGDDAVAEVDEPSPRLFPRLRAEETIELPIGEVREALRALASRIPELAVHRLVDGAALEEVATVAGAFDIRPGDQLILPCEVGLADAHGWAPESTTPVLDLSPLLSGELLMTQPLLENLLGSLPTDLNESLHALVQRDEESGELLEPWPGMVAIIVEQLADEVPRDPAYTDAWQQLVAGLDVRLISGSGVTPHLRTPKARRAYLSVAADAFDELSFSARSIDLFDHCGAVGERARAVALRIGLSDELAEVLHLAGDYHDLGKADSRFQRWLDPSGSADGLVAKSSYSWRHSEAARVASGWPRGGRHEVLSMRLAQAHAAKVGTLTVDDDLLLHLIVSHHGEGRSGAPVAAASPGLAVEVEIDGQAVSVQSDLGLPDWNQPRRFHQLCTRYGYWGLSLLEAVLRKADHAASAEAARAGNPGR